jgi:hypothetical protein
MAWRLLLEDAGFRNVETEYDGAIDIRLNDHGEDHACSRRLPMHVFAVAQC